MSFVSPNSIVFRVDAGNNYILGYFIDQFAPSISIIDVIPKLKADRSPCDSELYKLNKEFDTLFYLREKAGSPNQSVEMVLCSLN